MDMDEPKYMGMTSEKPAGPLLIAAIAFSRQHTPPRRCGRGRRGDVFVVRGADYERKLLPRLLSRATGRTAYAESLSFFPDLQNYNVGPDEYLDLIRRAKEAVDIPIIGSLNGTSTGGWIDYAALIEEAGADAIELNVYYIPTSTYLMGDRGRIHLHRHTARREEGGSDSGRDEAQPVLQLHREHGRAACRRGGRRARAV